MGYMDSPDPRAARRQAVMDRKRRREQEFAAPSSGGPGMMESAIGAIGGAYDTASSMIGSGDPDPQPSPGGRRAAVAARHNRRNAMNPLPTPDSEVGAHSAVTDGYGQSALIYNDVGSNPSVRAKSPPLPDMDASRSYIDMQEDNSPNPGPAAMAGKAASWIGDKFNEAFNPNYLDLSRGKGGIRVSARKGDMSLKGLDPVEVSARQMSPEEMTLASQPANAPMRAAARPNTMPMPKAGPNTDGDFAPAQPGGRENGFPVGKPSAAQPQIADGPDVNDARQRYLDMLDQAPDPKAAKGDMREALFSAGMAMLGDNGSFWDAASKGGMAGMAAYKGSEKEARDLEKERYANKLAKAQVGYNSARDMRADSRQERDVNSQIDTRGRSLDETGRSNRAQEGIARDRTGIERAGLGLKGRELDIKKGEADSMAKYREAVVGAQGERNKAAISKVKMQLRADPMYMAASPAKKAQMEREIFGGTVSDPMGDLLADGLD